MRTIAFIGPSGTGKSHRAVGVAKKYGADGFIDDGLLISKTRVLAGTSAKRENTKIASVKRALFTSEDHSKEVKKAIKDNNLKCIMILGTSDGMVNRIAQMLDIAPIDEIIRIQDIASETEMNLAKEMRMTEGKHIIPVPTFELKKDFSGYFLHPIRTFYNLDNAGDLEIGYKSIVRPTFSYMGDYRISDNVIADMATYIALKNTNVHRVNSINIRKKAHGIHMDIILTLNYGCYIPTVCKHVQYYIQKEIEMYTSINVRRVHIYVRSLNREK